MTETTDQALDDRRDDHETGGGALFPSAAPVLIVLLSIAAVTVFVLAFGPGPG